MTHHKSQIVGAVSLLLLGGCGGGLGRPLTPEEATVEIAPGDQDTSIALQEKCEPKGMVEFDGADLDEIKAKAHEMGADTAQVLFLETRTLVGQYSSETTTLSSDVRMWLCNKVAG